MILKELSLFNFRNHTSTKIELSSGLNFFYGLNAQGKTTFLEAIDLLSHLATFRSKAEEDFIQFGCEKSQVKGSFETLVNTKTNFDLSIELSRTQRKIASINNKPIKSTIQYFKKQRDFFGSNFYTVSFNPNDHELLRGEPKQRRRYLDRAISAIEEDSLDEILKFQKILEQRNSILKSEHSNLKKIEMLELFNSQFISSAQKIISRRQSWLSSIQPLFEENKSGIFRSVAPVELKYSSSPQEFLERFEKSKNKELFAGMTLVGPHRDDWNFYQQNRLVKDFASQGELRTLLLALKMAEITFFYQQFNHFPVLLLDDFSSELDHERRSNVVHKLLEKNWQVFVTSTEKISLPGVFFKVEDGRIEVSKE